MLSAFLGIGTLASIFIYLSRRFSSVPCPHCFKSIPKDTHKYSVPCPECSSIISGPLVTAATPEECVQCKSTSRVTPLWDGNVYCRSCIVDQSPALLAAAHNDLYTETLPYRVGDLAKRALWYLLRLIGGFAAFFGLPMVITSGIADGAFLFGVLFLCGTPVILLWTMALSAALPLMRIKMTVWRGQMIVRVGTHLLVAPLADCSWRDGEMSELTIWKFGFLLRGPSIIVELPKSVSPDGNCVAVGCTSAALEIWRSFFTIAGVPVMPRKSKRSWFKKMFAKPAT